MRMGVKGYCQNFSVAFAWNREWKQLKLNAFEACMTTYFLINLCYECDGHVTRQTTSDRQVAKFALGKPWAYQQARLPIHSRDFRHSSYSNVKLSPCLWSRSSSSYSGTNIYIVSMCGWPTCEHLGFEIYIISYLLKCRVHLKVLTYLFTHLLLQSPCWSTRWYGDWTPSCQKYDFTCRDLTSLQWSCLPADQQSMLNRLHCRNKVFSCHSF